LAIAMLAALALFASTVTIIANLCRLQRILQRAFYTSYCESIKVPKKQKQWITFKVSELEMRAIETYCTQTQRTKTDVLRELIRKLPTYTNLSNPPSTSSDE